MWLRSNLTRGNCCGRAIAHVRGVAGSGGDLAVTAGGKAPVCTLLDNGIVLDYLVPDGWRYRAVTCREIQAQGLSREDQHQIGLSNLADTLARGQLRLQPCVTFCRVTLDGFFEASLLLLDNLWEAALRRFVPGDYLASAPRGDALLFCRADLPGSRRDLLKAAAALVGERLTAGRTAAASTAGAALNLGECLFRRTGGRWLREAPGM